MITHLVRDRIKGLCNNKNFTIHKLAMNSGISYETVRDFMNCKSNNIGIVTLKKLCDGLDISITDFFDTPQFRSLEQEIKWLNDDNSFIQSYDI